MIKHLYPIYLFFILTVLTACQLSETRQNHTTLEIISLVLNDASSNRLNTYKRKALKNGIISAKEKKWVSARFNNKGKSLKAKIRLKGDWTDHIKNDTFSIRIKLLNKQVKKHNSDKHSTSKKQISHYWNRLNDFSLQLPESRNNLNEWVYHKMLERENVLTPRYGFVELEINNRSKGIFAYEEHFAKQLVEYKHRREGPILKFNEDKLWEIRKNKAQFEDGIPIFDPAIIEAFKMKKTLQTPSLRRSFYAGQSLMYNFKFGLMTTSQVFDIKILAKFIAILDVNKAFHNFIWHNLRFYYNPIIQKLEPIGFDAFTHNDIYNKKNPFLGYYKIYNSKYIDNRAGYVQNIFCDSVFVSQYLYYLQLFSDSGYIDHFLSAFSPEIDSLEAALQTNNEQYSYDRNSLHSNAKEIRNQLTNFIINLKTKKIPKSPLGADKTLATSMKVLENPEYFLNVYQSSDTTLDIENFIPEDLILTGLGKKKKSKKSRLTQKISAYKGIVPKQTQTININVIKNAKVLFFKTTNNEKEYNVRIIPWPAPKIELERELLLKNALTNTQKVYSIKGQHITFNPGKYICTEDIIIPSGYIVEFKAGHELDLTDSAKFISFSPITMNGSQNNSIRIYSSDHSAKGFSILLDGEESKLKHVSFENLGALESGHWRLTGAVCFYKTKLTMEYCSIENNHCEDALNTINSVINIRHSVIKNTFSDGFDSDFCTGSIEYCTISKTGNDALDFSGSKVNISNCQLRQIGDKGISCGEESDLIVDNIIIEKAVWGIAAKDLSSLILTNSEISDCEIGLYAFMKKREYGGATINAQKITLKNIGEETKKDAYSKVSLN